MGPFRSREPLQQMTGGPLLAEAGIPAERACIEWFFPFRYSVSCRKEIET